MSYPIKIKADFLLHQKEIDFFSEVESLFKESKNYISSFIWCNDVLGSWLFTNIGKALCIFLFEIINTQSTEDNLIWVIVGDFPAIYLDTYNVKSTREVVENYIELVNDWIIHAKMNQSLEACFPLDSPTTENAILMLERRVEFMKKEILPSIANIKYSLIKD